MDNGHVSELYTDVQRCRGALHWYRCSLVQRYTSTVFPVLMDKRTVVGHSKVQTRYTMVHPKLIENSQKAQKVEKAEEV